MDLYGTIQPVQQLEGVIMLVAKETGSTAHSCGSGGVYNAAFGDPFGSAIMGMVVIAEYAELGA